MLSNNLTGRLFPITGNHSDGYCTNTSSKPHSNIYNHHGDHRVHRAKPRVNLRALCVLCGETARLTHNVGHSPFTPIPPTETPTETLTITPSPPLDLLTLQLNLPDLLLRKSDLPNGANYRSNNIIPSPNKSFDFYEVNAYLSETGRIDGWTSYFIRGSNNIIAPQDLVDTVNIYKTAEGAQLTITKYDDAWVTEDGYTEEINPPKIGDLTRAFFMKAEAERGVYYMWYRIDFSFRNTVHYVYGYGLERDIQPEFVRNVARLLLARLQASPLLNP